MPRQSLSSYVRSAWSRVAGLCLLAACDSTSIAPPPSGTIAFAVFGDAPYYPWESLRYQSALRQIDEAQLSWLLHVGDLFWRPCSDAMMAERRTEFDAMRTPVVYVPGDNEWADCHTEQTGRFDPLERLAHLRITLLPVGTRSLGAAPITVESQSTQAEWAEFTEHRRWQRGRALFATLHLVGSGNGRGTFATRTSAHDAEVVRRSAAVVAWMGETFDSASAIGSGLVVLAWHGNPGFNTPKGARDGYEAVLDTLRVRAVAFPGQVLVIHGDSHDQHVDQPLFARNGRRLDNVTRLETFGSPEVGWVQVNVDTAQGRVTGIVPHLMPKRAVIF